MVLPTHIPQPLVLPLSEGDLAAINTHLADLTPEEILEWAVAALPGLYQTTAFGLTGLVAIDMLSKIASATTPTPTPTSTSTSASTSTIAIATEIATATAITTASAVSPPLIFLDTLYHFTETYELVEEVRRRYTASAVHVFKPEGCESVRDFEQRWGERLWERDEARYDYLVKVEPARRAYEQLGVQCVITGRRASQGGERAGLQPLEVDATGLLKLNPLCAWTFPFVEWYATAHAVPRNALLARGYRSIGDWHSTVKVAEGEEERAGRWKGREKTECGLHSDYYEMKAKAKAKVDADADAGRAKGEEKEAAPVQLVQKQVVVA